MLTFQQIILKLQSYWDAQGCALLQPYDMEVGAGTFAHRDLPARARAPSPGTPPTCSPAAAPRTAATARTPTACSTTTSTRWCSSRRRPTSWSSTSARSRRWASISKKNDIRFVEDDWENPTLGAWGLGWEVWLNGMEVTQFTYFQQVGGIDCKPITGEITYGLERLAMYLQGVDNVYNLKWTEGLSYGDVYQQNEVEQSTYNFEHSDAEFLFTAFGAHEKQAKHLMEQQLALPAYEQVLKAAHSFNLLDARGAISVTERAAYIGRIRNLARSVAQSYYDSRERLGIPDGAARVGRRSMHEEGGLTHGHQEESARRTVRRRTAAQGAARSSATPLPACCATSSKAQGLADAGSVLTAFASPRRLAAHLSRTSPRRPRTRPCRRSSCRSAWGWMRRGNATPALLKKLRSLGADASAVPGLKRAMDGKAEALFYDSTAKGATLAEGLQKALNEAIAKLPIPKVMSYQLETAASCPAGPA